MSEKINTNINKTLFILNAQAYGSELSYNGLRLATSLAKRENEEVRVFLMGDGATVAKRGQKTPQGYYNLELMLTNFIRHSKSDILVCGSCMDARGISSEELVAGCKRSTLDELTTLTIWADKVLVF